MGEKRRAAQAAGGIPQVLRDTTLLHCKLWTLSFKASQEMSSNQYFITQSLCENLTLETEIPPYVSPVAGDPEKFDLGDICENNLQQTEFQSTLPRKLFFLLCK